MPARRPSSTRCTPSAPWSGCSASLARRWLLAFGPAQAADLQWWTGWTAGQRKDGEIVVRLLEDAGAQAAAAIAAEAQRLREWIGSDQESPRIRITPRFRTPLERELAG